MDRDLQTQIAIVIAAQTTPDLRYELVWNVRNQVPQQTAKYEHLLLSTYQDKEKNGTDLPPARTPTQAGASTDQDRKVLIEAIEIVNKRLDESYKPGESIGITVRTAWNWRVIRDLIAHFYKDWAIQKFDSSLSFTARRT